MAAGPGAQALCARLLKRLDPRLHRTLTTALEAPGPVPELPDGTRHVVLVGHRAAGKTSVLPLVGRLLGRRAVDLDREIARRHRRDLKAWVQADEPGFRAAEREVFQALPPGMVVAAGGGFLSLHADLLAPHMAVLLPLSFQTYRERLLASDKRPRLRPDLDPEEEIRQVFDERERLHAQVETVPLIELLRAAVRREQK